MVEIIAEALAELICLVLGWRVLLLLVAVVGLLAVLVVLRAPQ